MVKVLFVCLGNICRSPMAEFLFKEYVKKQGVENDFYIESAATSDEELGNPVHYGTRRVLENLGIDCAAKRARKITLSDYSHFDYIIGMDETNRRDLKRFFGGDAENKIFCLLDFTDSPRDIADPWWTGDFETTFNDISFGLKYFFKFAQKK